MTDRIGLDRLTSDQLDQLYARLDTLEAGARERSALLEEARDALEAAGINEAHGGDSWPCLVPAIEELAKRIANLRVMYDVVSSREHDLTAGQCTHTLAVCQQHHRVPVDGCPYPRCVAARKREADL